MVPETMHGQALALGAQLRAAAPLAQGALAGAGPFRNVALCGLGGSAAGGAPRRRDAGRPAVAAGRGARRPHAARLGRAPKRSSS